MGVGSKNALKGLPSQSGGAGGERRPYGVGGAGAGGPWTGVQASPAGQPQSFSLRPAPPRSGGGGVPLPSSLWALLQGHSCWRRPCSWWVRSPQPGWGSSVSSFLRPSTPPPRSLGAAGSAGLQEAQGWEGRRPQLWDMWPRPREQGWKPTGHGSRMGADPGEALPSSTVGWGSLGLQKLHLNWGP